jgi:hypothetical protein
LCLANHPDGDASFAVQEMTSRLAEDCYRNSPYDSPARADQIPEGLEFEPEGVDEPRWYRTSVQRGLGYMADDPVEALRRAGEKLLVAYRDDSDAMPGAVNFTSAGSEWAGDLGGPLDLAADLWLWAVLASAALGLAVVPVCRRASPIWAVPLLVTALVLLGTSYPHYRHLAVPFLVVLAAGGVVGVLDRLRPQRPEIVTLAPGARGGLTSVSGCDSGVSSARQRSS